MAKTAFSLQKRLFYGFIQIMTKNNHGDFFARLVTLVQPHLAINFETALDFFHA